MVVKKGQVTQLYAEKKQKQELNSTQRLCLYDCAAQAKMENNQPYAWKNIQLKGKYCAKKEVWFFVLNSRNNCLSFLQYRAVYSK